MSIRDSRVNQVPGCFIPRLVKVYRNNPRLRVEIARECSVCVASLTVTERFHAGV
jgi:hypothetical protein